MNFIEELRWRGMLHDMTPGLEEVIMEKKIVGYIGFDPTAPSLTIGNYVQLMILRLFQKHGHQPIVLLGGATGRIGDPSGKDQERSLKSYDELDQNTQAQIRQFKELLEFDAPNKPIIFNNYEIYKEQNILDFLRDVGKTITISYMLSKDSVKNRLEKGLSFTEFSYQLLQGYDFQYLFERHNCQLQMGGSDQWGNITSGTEFIRRNLGQKAYAATTPLLTKADGTKFGKSAEGNIWISPQLTSPYQFFQYWLNSDDRDLEKFLKYFSLKPLDEIESLVLLSQENPREVKAQLAEELTVRIHGHKAYKSVLRVSELLFNPKINQEFLASLDLHDWQSIAQEIPTLCIDQKELSASSSLLHHSTGTQKVFATNSEGRRAIQANALSLNKIKVTDVAQSLTTEDLYHGSYALLENGKKNKYLLSVY